MRECDIKYFMKKYRCEYCDSEWSMPKTIKVPTICPFCGKDRFGYYPDMIMHRILNKYTIDLFEDERRFRAVIDDLFYKDKGTVKRLIIAQREQIHNRYQEVSVCTDKVRQNVLRQRCISCLMNEIGMAEQYAIELDNMFFQAFCCGDTEKDYGDANDAYYKFASDFYERIEEYDIDKEEEWNEEISKRIMTVSALAGNKKAQDDILSEWVFRKMPWIDVMDILEWAESLYEMSMCDVEEGQDEEKAWYAAIIADSYAYGFGRAVNLEKAIEWYLKSNEANFRVDVAMEILFREHLGLGCEKVEYEEETLLKYIESLFETEKLLEKFELDTDISSLIIDYEKKLCGGKEIGAKEMLRALIRCRAFRYSCAGEYEKSAFWYKQIGEPILVYWKGIEECYAEELPKDKNVYEMILQHYLEENEFVKALRYLVAAGEYGNIVDYGLIGYIYYNDDYGIEDNEKAFKYLWKEYKCFDENLDYFDWDGHIEGHHISERSILSLLLDLLYISDGKYLSEVSMKDALRILGYFEKLDGFTDKIQWIATFVLEQRDIRTPQELKELMEYFEVKKASKVYSSLLIPNSRIGNDMGELLWNSAQITYALRIYETAIMKAVPYLFNTVCLVKINENNRHILHFLAVCQICGLEIKKNVTEGIRLFLEACTPLDHENMILCRLAHLLESNGELGDILIEADTEAANIVGEIAREKEDEKRMAIIGYDSTYAGFISMLFGGWDENVVSFYNYSNLGFEENDSRMGIRSLPLQGYIIERLEASGYHSILQLNGMNMSQVKKIPKLGETSAVKIQRAMRDYFPQFFWKTHNRCEEIM